MPDYQVSFRIPYLGIATSLWPSRSLIIDGRLTFSPIVAQFFYGDDPGSLGDDTGLGAAVIDLEINSRQYRAMLQLGASF